MRQTQEKIGELWSIIASYRIVHKKEDSEQHDNQRCIGDAVRHLDALRIEMEFDCMLSRRNMECPQGIVGP